jgi:hypothetical protein
MGGVYSTVVLVAGGLWLVACVALLLAWHMSRRERSLHERGVPIALADEFLLAARQAERALTVPAEAESPASAEAFTRYHRQAAILIDLLRAYLATDSSSLHHAEAIIVDLTDLRSGDQQRIAECRASLGFHRAMFASVIWSDVDRTTPQRERTPARGRLRQSFSHLHLPHR